MEEAEKEGGREVRGSILTMSVRAACMSIHVAAGSTAALGAALQSDVLYIRRDGVVN